ncbi:hypothetical protein SPI_06496 [Niveomyces insectorum RCEF 264]|uniref:TMEM205-like domain-containing protein n=1 Tax=Niveomyces insectorum RCEF 264 TaxID=1081102 RepID=A0A167RAU4_9HYPO|nr:hypothetical protein SPI_06496 [Niveomyces insectorum RCEF 264]
MPDFGILLTPAPYHLLSFGILLGTTFFHSFVNGIVQFRTLPRPQFAAVQTKLFPIYFGLQTALPVVMALTYPSGGGGRPQGGIASLASLAAPANRFGFFLPLAAVGLTGLANLVVLLPATLECMQERYLQERKDGKKSYDPGPHSQAMRDLNKRFGTLHGVSSLLNLTAFGMTLVYGVALSARLQ